VAPAHSRSAAVGGVTLVALLSSGLLSLTLRIALRRAVVMAVPVTVIMAVTLTVIMVVTMFVPVVG